MRFENTGGSPWSIVRDAGLQRLLLPDGIDHLVEQIRQQAVPLQSEEADHRAPR